MAGVITTGNHPKLLWPGLAGLFGTTYNDTKMMHTKIFDVRTSDKLYEEIQELNGFGLASVKTEGSGITYTSNTQGPTTRFTNVVYGLGFQETRESVEDNQYKGKATSKTKALARSMRHTKETVLANIFNRATNSSYAGGDGKELIATDHPTVNGTQSNELATPADFSEASLEDLTIQMRNATDSTGLRINLMPKRLLIPTNLEFEAIRVLKSNLRSNSAENDTNAVKTLDLETVIWPFLTDTDQWFLLSEGIDEGMILFNRRAAELEKDSDFDTDNFKHKSTERYVGGWGDWRAVFGSAGAP